MTITTTLNRIRAHEPCESGWKKLLAGLNKTKADDEPLPFARIVEINGLADALWCCRAEPQYAREWRLYAVWCARQVQHLMTDERSVAAIDVAERFANGEATEKELAAAEAAAWVAQAAAWAAACVAEAAEVAAWVAAWVAEAAAQATAEVAAEAAAGAAQATAQAAAWVAAWVAEAAWAAAWVAEAAEVEEVAGAAWAAGAAQKTKFIEIVSYAKGTPDARED